MKKLLAVLLLCTLVSCSVKSRPAKIDWQTWVGKPASDVISKYGFPRGRDQRPLKLELDVFRYYPYNSGTFSYVDFIIVDGRVKAVRWDK